MALAIGVGVVVYAILLYFIRIPEFDPTLEMVKGKIGVRIGEVEEE